MGSPLEGQECSWLVRQQQGSSLPRLKLARSGVQRDRANKALPPSRQRLPITPAILRRLHQVWFPPPGTPCLDDILVWAAATLCFFGFFRAGELMVPTVGAFEQSVHLA